MTAVAPAPNGQLRRAAAEGHVEVTGQGWPGRARAAQRAGWRSWRAICYRGGRAACADADTDRRQPAPHRDSRRPEGPPLRLTRPPEGRPSDVRRSPKGFPSPVFSADGGPDPAAPRPVAKHPRTSPARLRPEGATHPSATDAPLLSLVPDSRPIAAKNARGSRGVLAYVIQALPAGHRHHPDPTRTRTPAVLPHRFHHAAFARRRWNLRPRFTALQAPTRAARYPSKPDRDPTRFPPVSSLTPRQTGAPVAAPHLTLPVLRPGTRSRYRHPPSRPTGPTAILRRSQPGRHRVCRPRRSPVLRSGRPRRTDPAPSAGTPSRDWPPDPPAADSSPTGTKGSVMTIRSALGTCLKESEPKEDRIHDP